MKIKDTVTILGRPFAVKTGLPDNEVHSERNADGFISHRSQEIRIMAGLTECRETETFLHEVIHGIIDNNYLEENFVSKEKVEDFVGRFSLLLLDTIRRNELNFLDESR